MLEFVPHDGMDRMSVVEEDLCPVDSGVVEIVDGVVKDDAQTFRGGPT